MIELSQFQHVENNHLSMLLRESAMIPKWRGQLWQSTSVFLCFSGGESWKLANLLFILTSMSTHI